MVSTAGRLLVATPVISDGVFDRSVVFMLHHDPVGALGVVINRPSDLAVDELLPRWSDLTTDPSVIFSGGPVEPDGFIGVAMVAPDSHQLEMFTPVDDAPATSNVVSLDLEGDPAIAASVVERMRIFRGYAGWGPGQLDSELAHDAWFALNVDAGDLWAAEPDQLYDRVLRRQPGRLGWFANAPADPTLN